MPRIRRDATRLFRKGWSARKIGRHLGYHHTAVMKWVQRAKLVGDVPILTQSSAPKHVRQPTAKDVVDRIVKLRIETKRCAKAIYKQLKREGVKIAKCTVHRILSRRSLLNKRSPYKRFHPHVHRTQASKPGDLGQMDSIHLMIDKKKRIYVLVFIDVYSRWAYAHCFSKMTAKTAVIFLRQAVRAAPFAIDMIQTDHGPEFGAWFVSQIKKQHRYTRIGKPNDNAHIERCNRTLQEECLDKVEVNVLKINRAITKYLIYYNNQRLHLGINAMIPIEMVPRY